MAEASRTIPVGPPANFARLDGPVGLLELYWFRPMADLTPRFVMRPWVRTRDGWLLFWITVGTIAAVFVHFLSLPKPPIEMPVLQVEPEGPIGTWRQHDLGSARHA